MEKLRRLRRLYFRDGMALSEIGRKIWFARNTVKNCRNIGKKNMVHNSYTPKIEVDPENYLVRADGELLMCEPASVLPMAQRYFLF